jgi:hypothetical protein
LVVGALALPHGNSVKADHLTIHRFIRWLGPFVESRHSDFPAFAGHIVAEYAPRPFLMMGIGDELVLEDTNPPDSYWA